MEAFLIYIAKVSIAAGAFYLAYLLLFQKQKHFDFNRIYLPVSMLVSFIIPLITFTTFNYVESVAHESYSPTISYTTSTPVEYVAPAFEFQWYHYLFGLYILGVAGFLLHLLMGHIKAMHIIRTSKIQKLFNHLINITKKDVHPFSFFNKIVLSEKILSSPDLEMIVTHEKIHVREKHTFDILIAEFMFVLQWFNPFAWLMKGEVRNNLEYKTDDQIAKTYDPKRYQLAMVALADKKEVAPFLTALNGSQLKNRIMMMKQKTENKFKVARQLVVLPLLAILVMGLSNKEVKTEFIQATAKVEVIVDGKVIPSNDENLNRIDFAKGVDSEVIIEALDIKNVIANSLTIDGEIQKLYIRTANYVPGTNREFEENTTRNIVLDENKLAEEYFYAIDNKLVGREEFLKQGKIGFDHVIFLSGEDATDKYGDEYPIVADATSGVPNFVIEDGNEDWTGENTNLEFYEEKFLDPEMEKFNEHLQSIMKDGIATLDPTREDFPYTFLNNEEVKHKVVVNQADLKYGEIIPPKEAVKEFGEKGENGVLIFSTEAGSIEDFRENYGSKLRVLIEERIIRGKITDKDGNPLVQANVVQYNNRGRIISGVVTDNKGAFVFKLEPNVTTLTVSKKGYKSKEVNVEGKEEVNVKLEVDSPDDELKKNGSSSKEKTESTTTSPNRIPTEAEWENAASKNKIIRGKITDKDGNPLVQANVVQYNNRGRMINGVVTDNKGTFAIKLEPNVKALTISKRGYKSKEVNVEGKEEISVKLEKDADELKGNSSISLSMGQMGVAFNVGDSKINSTSNEELGSSNDVSDKLYIIDGEITKDPGAIQIEDITNMTVLKNPTATNLYGDKGKNGVVIITTKNGTSDIDGNIKIDEIIENQSKEITVKKANKIIRGKITDKDGNPLVQANVVQYNNRGRIISGVVTDNKGAFAIKLEPSVTALTASKKGYKSKEVNVEGKEEIEIILEKGSDDIQNKSGQQNSIDSGLSPNKENNPLIIVDGRLTIVSPELDFDFGSATVEDFGKLLNIAPGNIKSIEVLKDAAAIAAYGEMAKRYSENFRNEAFVITTNRNSAINSIQELRQFIAKEIVFPTEARDELNDQLNMRFYVRVNNKGEITDVGENIAGDGEIFPIDEIVVTALRPKNVVKELDIKNGNLMAKEAERVLNKLPDIEIPGAKGKILEIWFKFVLEEQ